MDEIGLFPLGLVLLPTEQVPLHIFEPRYRELIGESLDHGGPFGIVYADEDGLRQIGTLATVTEVVEPGGGAGRLQQCVSIERHRTPSTRPAAPVTFA